MKYTGDRHVDHFLTPDGGHPTSLKNIKIQGPFSKPHQ